MYGPLPSDRELYTHGQSPYTWWRHIGAAKMKCALGCGSIACFASCWQFDTSFLCRDHGGNRFRLSHAQAISHQIRQTTPDTSETGRLESNLNFGGGQL